MPKKIIACDVESTGLRQDCGDRIFAVSMTTYSGENFYWRFNVNPLTREVSYDKNLDTIKEILSDKDALFVFHNSLFDLGMFKAIGVNVLGGIADTLLISDCVANDRPTYALKPLCKSILNFPDNDEKDLHEATRKARAEGKKLGYKLADDLKADFWLAPEHLCEKYAVSDTQRTMALFKYYEPLLNLSKEESEFGPFKHLKDIIKLEHKFIKPVLDMNTNGVCLDVSKLDELEKYYAGVISGCEAEMLSMGFGDINAGSAKQRGELFYDKLGMKEVTRRRKNKDGTTSNTRTTDKKALAGWAIENPVANTLIKISEARQQINTFVKPLKALGVFDGTDVRLRPSFNISGAHATGRFSCSEPNLQNITTPESPMRLSDIEARVREAFIPAKGKIWLLADYAQVETVVTAYLSQDSLLKDLIETGKSQHDLTRDSIFSDRPDFSDPARYKTYRKLSKIVNFSLPYGTGPKKLMEAINVSYPEAKVIWDRYWETYKGVKHYSDTLEDIMKRDGYIMDVFGRTYKCPKGSEYKSLNRMVQGTCAGIFKRAFLEAVEALSRHFPDFRVVLGVHDEIIVEGPLKGLTDDIGRLIRASMQQSFHTLIGKPTPLEVQLSLARDNWATKEDWKV